MTLGENIIGKRISAELLTQGKTQKWLAKQIGCTECSMTRYIDGSRIPKATTLLKIADALDVDANRLLGREAKDDEEEFELTPKGIALISLLHAELIDEIDDPRFNEFWNMFVKRMNDFGYTNEVV